MSILFCGYRSWALDTLEALRAIFCNDMLYLVENAGEAKIAFGGGIVPGSMRREYEGEYSMDARTWQMYPKFDLVLCAGWSWIMSEEEVSNNVVVGIHPSDLPDYAGGSPLQHQIIDGMTETECTLFRLRPGLDKGEIVYKETMSLEGGIQEIFEHLRTASVKLFAKFMFNYPDVEYKLQLEEGTIRKRLKPEDGKLFVYDDYFSQTLLEVYNQIRCREAPYPNAFIEDESGTLYFEKVRFEPK